MKKKCDKGEGGRKVMNPLAKIRTTAGLSQKQAAIKIGVGPGSWNNWERKGMGARLSLAQIAKIDEVFGVRLSDLLTGTT